MKRITNPQLLISCLVFLFFLLPTITHAQPGFGDDVNDVPVDGGLSLLLAAGVGYGAKKLKKSRSNKL
jgi:hypothetical protein